MTRALVALALLACVCACGGAVRREPALLRVVVEPVVTRVYVDDRFRATSRVLSRRPLALTPGVHIVTLEADGYFPHDLRVDLPEGDTTVTVRLRPVPP